MKQETKTCQNCKQQFVIEPDDFTFYEKMEVPPPVFCPECRQKQRIIFRNFKTLYKRNSSKSGKPMIAMYSAKTPFPVWNHNEWWADDWDASDYGRDFNFNRPFFEQFKDLLFTVPRFGIMNVQSQNCEYSNFIGESKNCYLVFGCVDSEDCAYGHIVWESKDSFDNLYLYQSELCHECVDCVGCYRLFYSQECESCTDGIGLYDCRGCTNCIGCVGLKQKSYHLFNENVGKEKYQQFLNEHPLHNPTTVSFIIERREALRRQLPQRHFFGSHNNNVSGNHIYYSKNSHYAFDAKYCEDAKFVFTGRKIIDTYDESFTVNLEHGYYAITCRGNNIRFSHLCFECNDVSYCDSCFNSQNLFGCAGMKSREYCIFNKQYTKEEYEKLVPRIIEHMKKTGEWGDFFPKELSFFAYNESIINEYYPLSREEALAQGYTWVDELPMTVGQETTTHDTFPKNPSDYSEELLKHILKCHCGRNYRFIPQEIQFYKRVGILLSTECPNCRHARRMSFRNPRRLWDGKCAKCGASFKTSYPPEGQKQYKLYCETCYLAEMG